MSLRLILWTVVMAYVGFLIVGKGSNPPMGVTITGLLLGGGMGLVLAAMFSRRAKRKREPSWGGLRRY
jgi:hypothetical protein